MCGIVGLLVKTPALRQQLGELMVPMLIGMTERGPDSAGLAVFAEPLSGSARKLSLYSGLTDDGADFNWHSLTHALREQLGIDAQIEVRYNHAVLRFDVSPDLVKRWLHEHHPRLHILSTGQTIDLYKDVGTPAEVAQRYDFAALKGSHLVGHTRMATESAVTPDRAHPFTAGEDFCLVHNGSLSNPNSLRRMLEPRGIHFDTDNDTEAACRFLEWRLREGDDLETGAAEGLRGARRVLHLPHGYPRQAGPHPRPLRLQAGGGRRDRRLRGDRQRVPLAGTPARREARQGVRAGARGDVRYGTR
jgi:amidophosphoribosyltransferase